MRPDTSGRSSKRNQEEEFAYSDHLFFDNVRPSLPDPSNGRHVLFVYVCLEALLILFGFLAHHHKASDFSCCNAWAVFIAFLFLGVQWPYYNEWCSKLGYTASWHRGNMYAPMFLYYILWVGWLFATLSMLAHNDGNDFFTINLSAMEGNELTAVVVCTLTVIPGVFLGIAISHSYRNSLATHYYAPKEGAASLTHLSTRPHPTEGSFHYRNILGTMSRIVLCENSAEAEQHMPYVYRAFVILMGVFYAFSIMTLAQNVSGFLITSIITGLVVFGLNVRDGLAMFKTDSLKYRTWYRHHLLSPLYSVFNMLATYFFAMSSVFFRAGANTFGTSNSQWESLITDLDPTEKGYFAVLFILMIALAGMSWLLVNLHRKAWAEWTKSVDDGLDYTPAGDKLELAKREKRAARQASGVDRHQSGRRKAPTRQRSTADDYYGDQAASTDRVNVDVDDEDEYEEDEEQLEEEYAREVYGGGGRQQQQQRDQDFGGPDEYYDDQEDEPRRNRDDRYDDE